MTIVNFPTAAEAKEIYNEQAKKELENFNQRAERSIAKALNLLKPRLENTEKKITIHFSCDINDTDYTVHCNCNYFLEINQEMAVKFVMNQTEQILNSLGYEVFTEYFTSRHYGSLTLLAEKLIPSIDIFSQK